MKNDLETILTNSAATETLSEEQRTRMRSVLVEYIAMRPLRSPVVRPTFPTLLFAYVTSVVRRPVAVLTLVLLLVFATTGSLAYASEGALPGDSLYTVKVNVLEPLRGALIFAPAAQAHWQLTLATRRVDEAATLASRGTLSSTTQAQLSNDFNQNLVRAHAFFAKEGASSDDATDADASMSARLSAYAMVFARINTDHPSPEAASFQTTLVSSISALSADTLTLSARAAPVASTSASKSRTTTPGPAVRARIAAQESLAATREQLSQGQGQLTASSSIAAYARLNDATDLVQEGDHLYASGDKTAAANAFKSALTATTQLNVLIRAATLLKVDTLSGDDAPNASANSRALNSASNEAVSPTTRDRATRSDTATTTAVSATSGAAAASTSSAPSSQTHTPPVSAAQSELSTPHTTQSNPSVVPPLLPVSL